MNDRRHLVRPGKFDPAATYVARRAMLFNGHEYQAGDPFDGAKADPRRFRWLFETRRIVRAQELDDGGNSAMSPKPSPGAEPAGARKVAEPAQVGLSVRHVGAGKFAVVNAKGERVSELMTKADAEAHLASL